MDSYRTTWTRSLVIASREGIGANYLDLGEVADRLEGPARPGDPLLLLVLVLPPLLLGGAALRSAWGRRRRRGPLPLERARAALAGDPDLATIRQALLGYYQARLELAAGELTPVELEQALRARVVPPVVVAQATSYWEALDRARFAGETNLPPDVQPAALLEEVDRGL